MTHVSCRGRRAIAIPSVHMLLYYPNGFVMGTKTWDASAALLPIFVCL